MKDSILFLSMAKASSQKGGALIYILIAIALLAALTTTFIQPGGQSTRTQNASQLAMTLNSQARVIRSAIQDCILRYPEGDSAITEVGYIDPYPLNPTSEDAQYAAYDNGDPGDYDVEDLRCPGSSYDLLFSGTGEFSSYLPSPPSLMEKWTYFNGSVGATAGWPNYGMAFNGIFYQIQSDKSDPFIAEAMTKLDNLKASCEVDYTVGDGTNGCENGHQCLRFWIIRNSGGPAC